MEVGSEFVEVVAVVADEVREAVGEGLSLAASQPVSQSARKVSSSASSTASLSSRLTSGMLVNSVGVDALDEVVEQGGAFGLSSFVGVVALPGEDG